MTTTTYPKGGAVERRIEGLDQLLGTEPLDKVEGEKMSSLSGGFSTPVLCNGNGVVGALIDLPDTTSADGHFFWAVTWATSATEALARMQAGEYKRLSVPTLPKNAGAGLTSEPLVLTKPAAPYSAVEYVPSTGGADDEITVNIGSW